MDRYAKAMRTTSRLKTLSAHKAHMRYLLHIVFILTITDFVKDNATENFRECFQLVSRFLCIKRLQITSKYSHSKWKQKSFELWLIAWEFMPPNDNTICTLPFNLFCMSSIDRFTGILTQHHTALYWGDKKEYSVTTVIVNNPEDSLVPTLPAATGVGIKFKLQLSDRKSMHTLKMQKQY